MKRFKLVAVTFCLLLVAMASAMFFVACGPEQDPADETPEKSENSITGLSDLTAVCGDAFPALNAQAQYGTVVYAVAEKDGSTAEEALSYSELPSAVTAGEYVIRASVAETEEYEGAVAYADLTVSHEEYTAIAGDPVRTVAPDAEQKIKGYSVKKCACGEEIRGDETVSITYKVDGVTAYSQTAVIGGVIGAFDWTKFPSSIERNGYEAALYTGDELFTGGDPVADFTEVDLRTVWRAKDDSFAYAADGVNAVKTNWTFDKTNVFGDDAYTLEYIADGIRVGLQFMEEYPDSAAELTLANLPFDEYHVIRFTVNATQGTYIYFGNQFNDAYAISDADAGKNVTVEIGIKNGVPCVAFNGIEKSYADWAEHNMNALTFRILDKNEPGREEFANAGKRYQVTIGNPVVLYDYMGEAEALAAALPDISGLTLTNAERIYNDILELEAIIDEHFTSSDEAALQYDWAELKEEANKFATDHDGVAMEMAKEFPDFDEFLAGRPTQDEQDDVYRQLARYLAYMNTKFTQEEAESYSEPDNISKYRRFFVGVTQLPVDVFAETETTMNSYRLDSAPAPDRFLAENGTFTMTFPKIAFGAYPELSIIFRMASSYAGVTWEFTCKDLTFTYTATSSAMACDLEFGITRGEDGYYLTLSQAGAPDKGTKMKLDDAIVIGDEGISFTLKTTLAEQTGMLGWCFINDNTINGTLDREGAETVYVVTYNYKTASGIDDQNTQYYLEGETLTLPSGYPATYTDAIGTHTFNGFFAAGSDKAAAAGDPISSDLVLTAQYTTDYKEYTVTFYDDAIGVGEPIGDASTVHYGDKLVLPAEPPTKEHPQEGMAYVFIGWFDADGKEYKGGETIEGDLDLYAKFLVNIKVTVTLTGLDGADETHEVLQSSVFARPENDPVREGYIFAGWFDESGKEYDFSSEIGEDTTIVARWKTWVPVAEQSVIVWENMIEDITSSTAVFDAGPEPDLWRMKTSAGSMFDFTLPKIDFRYYSEVSCIIVMGGTNDYTFSFGETTFENTGKVWNWLKVVYVGTEGLSIKNGAETLSEGYYITIGNTDVGAEWYSYAPLSEEVVSGEEAITFSITITGAADDWIKIYQNSTIQNKSSFEGKKVQDLLFSTDFNLTENSTEEEYRNYLKRQEDWTAYEKEHYALTDEQSAVLAALAEKYPAAE